LVSKKSLKKKDINAKHSLPGRHAGRAKQQPFCGHGPSCVTWRPLVDFVVAQFVLQQCACTFLLVDS